MSTTSKSGYKPSSDTSEGIEASKETASGSTLGKSSSGTRSEMPNSGQKSELIALALAIIGAHCVAFAHLAGIRLYPNPSSSSSIATTFTFLSCIILTIRIAFGERIRIQVAVDRGSRISVWPVIAIGILCSLVWILPFSTQLHAVEPFLACIGVATSILVSLAIERKFRTVTVAHDAVPLVVILFILAWVTLNHEHSSGTGEEFLNAATVGTSSLHSWHLLLAKFGKFAV